jgi:nicotinate-nucleotide pyrophosphorylase
VEASKKETYVSERSMVRILLAFCGVYALTFVIAEIDILSTSAVHQSVQHIDFSLKIQK